MDDAILRPFQQHVCHIRTRLDDIERLCAMESRVRLERFSPQTGLEPVTARNRGERSQKEITSQID